MQYCMNNQHAGMHAIVADSSFKHLHDVISTYMATHNLFKSDDTICICI